MFEILDSKPLAPLLTRMVVKAPLIAKKRQAGQFVIVVVDETGERIPLTIADADAEAGTVVLVFQEVGKSTALLAALKTGDYIHHLVGPLGKPTHIEKYGTVVCIGGGVGIPPVFPITQALKKAGNFIYTILGARSKDLLIMEAEMRSVSDETIITTDDGSYGRKGVVTLPLKELLDSQKIDLVVAIGPAIMMKFVCSTTLPYQVKTMVSLNSIMVDATGMCGACRVSIGGKNRFVCVDGPEFDGHQVDFNQLLDRQRMYCAQEKEAYDKFKHEHPKCY